MVMLTWFFGGEILLVLTGGLFLFYFWAQLPPELPWFYSLPWGENQLISKTGFAIGLMALALICLVNFLVARKLDKGDRVVAIVVESATLLLVGLYLASFYKVLSLMI